MALQSMTNQCTGVSESFTSLRACCAKNPTLKAFVDGVTAASNLGAEVQSYYNTTLRAGIGSWSSEEGKKKREAIGARIADEFSQDFLPCRVRPSPRATLTFAREREDSG